jgi:hypothetical protein
MTVYLGAELPSGALQTYAGCVGQFIAWGSFASFTTVRSVAEGFAKATHGGVGVVFELKTAGRPRIKSVSAHKREEELLLHPFSALRVEAVEGGVVRVTEVVVAQLANQPQMVTNSQGMGSVDTVAEIAHLKAKVEQLTAHLDEERAKTARLEAALEAAKVETAAPREATAEAEKAAAAAKAEVTVWRAAAVEAATVVEAKWRQAAVEAADVEAAAWREAMAEHEAAVEAAVAAARAQAAAEREAAVTAAKAEAAAEREAAVAAAKAELAAEREAAVAGAKTEAAAEREAAVAGAKIEASAGREAAMAAKVAFPGAG